MFYGTLPPDTQNFRQVLSGIGRTLRDRANLTAERFIQSAQEARALQDQAFGDPTRPTRVTDEAALRKLTDMIMAGPLGFAPAGITAYHGSPYLFRQFDPAKVGAGEGAQAYGVGAGYTAEARPVAEEYARNISRSKFIRDAQQSGQSSSYTTEASQLQQMIGDMPIQDFYTKLELQASRLPVKQAEDAYAKLDVVERLGLGSNIPDVRQYVKDAGYSKAVQEWVEKELVPKYKPAGFLYKGDIPDEILPKFLDWDKKFSDQTTEVKEAIKKYWDKNKVYGDPSKLSGAGIYDSIVAHVFGDAGRARAQQTASNELEKIGVRGIRYLDQGSRGEGKGTSNFIPFRSEDYKIQEINDIPIQQYIEQGLL